MSRVATILLLLVALGAPGCQQSVQTYAGPQRASCDVAVIVPENAFNRARSAPFGPACGSGEVRVRIEGQCLGGTHNTFTVLPGTHQLAVVYLDRTPRLNGRVLGTQAVALPLEAKAGHTYAIRGRTTWSGSTPTVSLWAVDGTTGQTVSSVVVPQANTRILGDESWWDEYE